MLTHVPCDRTGKCLPMHHQMSNFIDKSPRMGSVARALSWDDSCSGSASPDPSDPASHELVEQDWLLLMRKILSAAGIDGEAPWDAFSLSQCSLESPLYPSLRDKLANTDEEDLMHESVRRQRKTYRKLVFDSVNEALVKIMNQSLAPIGPQRAMLLSGKPSMTMLDRVSTLVREWPCHKMPADKYDGLSLAVEMAARAEEVVVGGRWWAENFSLEISNLGKQIELELTRELMNETLIDLL